ncbi:MAG: hypothetical protein GC153_06610 [Alphaproteobacteria bacterium]|nr:hypothetical protein [Alphaproteobacteria bacterium]
MDDLHMIKKFADEHGVGCVIREDHVALSVLWVTRNFVGETRCIEIVKRITSMAEARAAIAARPSIPPPTAPHSEFINVSYGNCDQP